MLAYKGSKEIDIKGIRVLKLTEDEMSKHPDIPKDQYWCVAGYATHDLSESPIIFDFNFTERQATETFFDVVAMNLPKSKSKYVGQVEKRGII